ncbi:NAD-dependent deacetylase [Sulfurimonas sp. HSL-3221]|uniref:SIR2 family NAD-dependent protein deacylase n=1 Tax=Sulfurimonadaceae TaxID=2771471 RepID=UPI001E37FC48|nr:Sir2 family NAD-dependent protein deacetylase [Sulfurimonas sp. HSL-3221]UFS62124.1 NAD-dependent deacetylase [Sulfurimonas sp. HSL-3221]
MKKVMILSGAGLSAESGLRTFRDHDGMWEEYDVMQVCSTEGWEADRELVTRFYNARRHDLADKAPNAMHRAIAELQRRYSGQIWNLTQNVDDLLERAGCDEVIHLHGTLRDLRCESCGHLWDIGYAGQTEDDCCPRCESAAVRHNVVMFGESAPMYRRIYEAVNDAELFVAIGTSGQVIDIVPIAREFEHSVLVNPRREEYVTMFGSFEQNIDAFFSDFLQMGAVAAAEPLTGLVERFLHE